MFTAHFGKGEIKFVLCMVTDKALFLTQTLNNTKIIKKVESYSKALGF